MDLDKVVALVDSKGLKGFKTCIGVSKEVDKVLEIYLMNLKSFLEVELVDNRNKEGHKVELKRVKTLYYRWKLTLWRL